MFLSIVKKELRCVLKLYWVLLILIPLTSVDGQDQHRIETLQNQLHFASDDSLKGNIYDQLVKAYIYADLERSILYNDSLILLGKQIDNENIVLQGKYNKSIILRQQGHFQEAIELLNNYINAIKYLNDSSKLCTAYYQKGANYYYLGKYKLAIESALQSAKLGEQTNLLQQKGKAFNLLSSIYSSINMTDKSLEYVHKALNVFKQTNDLNNMGLAYNNIGNTLKTYHVDSIPKATYYFKKALVIAKKINNPMLECAQYRNLGLIDEINKDFQSAEQSYINALAIRRKLGMSMQIVGSLADLARVNNLLKNYDTAERYYLEALKLAKDINAGDPIIYCYNGLSEVYENSKQWQKALKFNKLYQTTIDSLESLEIRKNLSELETKYQTAQKDKEIIEQQFLIEQQIKKQNMLIGIAILLSLLGIGIYLFYQQRLKNTQLIAQKTAELQQQKIIELEKTQKILALDAMITGQEEERKRIAQDLHDGLGGLLATVKVQFGIIQKEMNKLSEMNVYQKANEMLDDACTEVRRIAHNMMPDALLKLGLVEAITDMTKGIEQPKVEVLDLGMRKLSETQQIMLYRIIQEIIKNTIKHAYATQLIIQFSQERDQVVILLEDDGKGFEIANKEQYGLGLNSIDSRVKYLNGMWDIDSELGVGTTTTISIPLNSSSQK